MWPVTAPPDTVSAYALLLRGIKRFKYHEQPPATAETCEAIARACSLTDYQIGASKVRPAWLYVG